MAIGQGWGGGRVGGQGCGFRLGIWGTCGAEGGLTPLPPPQLLPKGGDLTRQPPTHPEETEEELTEQQEPPPAGEGPGSAPPPSPDAADPPEGLRDPQRCGAERGGSGDEAEAPGGSDGPELGVTYTQVRGGGSTSQHPQPPPACFGARPLHERPGPLCTNLPFAQLSHWQ